MGAARLMAGTSVDRKQRATWWTEVEADKKDVAHGGELRQCRMCMRVLTDLEFRKWFRNYFSRANSQFALPTLLYLQSCLLFRPRNPSNLRESVLRSFPTFAEENGPTHFLLPPLLSRKIAKAGSMSSRSSRAARPPRRPRPRDAGPEDGRGGGGGGGGGAARARDRNNGGGARSNSSGLLAPRDQAYGDLISWG